MDIRENVRNFYSSVAEGDEKGCCAPGCCAQPPSSLEIGYTAEQLASIPAESNLGLGCGNPTSFATIEEGDVVIDLGAGAGIDAFLAADRVGSSGRVIGVDMTPSMVKRARDAAGARTNVEFRLGEIEHLPVADGVADLIISNCVINLSPEKQDVFDEMFRALKPGGRVSISDIVATAPIPAGMREAVEAVVGCVGNAAHVDDIRTMLEESGFVDIDVQPKPESARLIETIMPGASKMAASAEITARKP